MRCRLELANATATCVSPHRLPRLAGIFTRNLVRVVSLDEKVKCSHADSMRSLWVWLQPLQSFLCKCGKIASLRTLLFIGTRGAEEKQPDIRETEQIPMDPRSVSEMLSENAIVTVDIV